MHILDIAIQYKLQCISKKAYIFIQSFETISILS